MSIVVAASAVLLPGRAGFDFEFAVLNAQGLPVDDASDNTFV